MVRYIFATLLIFSVSGVIAQDIKPLYRSLEKSNFKLLVSRLDDPVEVCINDEQDILDKSDAVAAIRAYFSKIKPKSITQIHKGTSANKGSQYRVAKVVTSTGNYRLFLYLERTKTGYIIKEFRIDPEN